MSYKCQLYFTHTVAIFIHNHFESPNQKWFTNDNNEPDTIENATHNTLGT
jgi:hypothetical protein